MLDTPRNHKHFTRLKVNPTVTQFDTHLSVKNDENLIRLTVTVPDKLALNLDQFKVVIIHLRDDLGRVMLRKLSQLFAEVN